MNNFNSLKKLFDKCKMSNELPAETRKFMLNSKKEILIKILKSEAKYGLFMFLTISVFFGFKRVGISLSLTKSAIIAATMSIVSSAAIVSGSYFTIKAVFYSSPEISIEQNNEPLVSTKISKPNLNNNTKISKKPVITNNSLKKMNYKLAVKPFSFDGVSSNVAMKISSKIVNRINLIKGPGTAKIINNSNLLKKSDFFLQGSIIFFDNNFLITLKIINSRSTKVVFYLTEESKNSDEFGSLCNSMGQKIANAIKW